MKIITLKSLNLNRISKFAVKQPLIKAPNPKAHVLTLYKPEETPELSQQYHQPTERAKNWTVHTALEGQDGASPYNPASYFSAPGPVTSTVTRPAFFDLDGPSNGSNQSKSEMAIRIIDRYDSCIQAYTDGSCTAGMEDGGAAAVITRGSARNPQVIKTIKKRGKKYTCSFDEELTAMGLALDWISQYFCMKAVVCTDCKSLLQAIESETPNTRVIRDKLRRTGCQIILQWTPSHCGIPGNELADVAAKEAAKLEQETADLPISYEIAKSLIKRTLSDPPPTHHLVKQTYSNHCYKKDLAVGSRKDSATLAQLRSGHSLLLAAYQHKIDEEKPDICPICEEEPQTVEHWLKCPGTAQKRQEIFGKTDLSPAVLGDHPLETLALARATLGRL